MTRATFLGGPRDGETVEIPTGTIVAPFPESVPGHGVQSVRYVVAEYRRASGSSRVLIQFAMLARIKMKGRSK